MEVVTILGAAASVATVVEVSASCINKLLDLRAKHKLSDMNVQVSVAQLATLKAALTQISAWTCEDTGLIPYHLGTDLNLSLSSCKTLVDGLNGHLSQIRIDGIATPSFGRKAKFLMNGREWSHLQTLLSHQISAIQLFLTTMQWYYSQPAPFAVRQLLILLKPDPSRAGGSSSKTRKSSIPVLCKR